MAQAITIQGLVATTPRHLKTAEGLDILSFRVASSDRRYDYKRKSWVDENTNWYTVTAFKQLAVNAHTSINKGDRIFVLGNLNIKDWDNGSSAGTSVEVEATAMGHDLSWGNSVFTRTVLVKDLSSDDLDGSQALAEELEKTKQQLTDLRELLGELSEARGA